MSKSAASTAGKTYAGLDVSLKETAVCIVDDAGRILCERMLPTDPRVIADCLGKHAPALERFGLESGATSAWLWREFRALGLPVVCLDSRHAHPDSCIAPPGLNPEWDFAPLRQARIGHHWFLLHRARG